MKKISVVGPESSGKTTLTKYLSKTLKCNYSEEYARAYLDKRKTYDVQDLIKIAREQNRIIKNSIKKDNEYFIADTSCLVIELWSKIKFNYVVGWIWNFFSSRKSCENGKKPSNWSFDPNSCF